MNDIIIYSRKDAEKAIRSGNFPKNTSVISFYDPQTEHIKYEDICSDVYYCPYDDIDVWSEREYEKYSSTFDFADDLAQFIYDAYNSGRDIVCQCDYGQSRSAGCAAAIAEHFYKSGIGIFADFTRCPNKLIYHKVIDALNDFSHNNKIPDQRRV